ncbi:sialate O-acetylesterase [Eubacterium sp.]|uniref:sialate O-acetylesterase n=1 Tax=Eubacterium sp. TaxID=142586 RepID=UPI00258824F4|nr:sialate O-acetylesterase [Eubacterium sp.]MCR5367188.1 sialate O-acetylesterase [Eubacterium sp.]
MGKLKLSAIFSDGIILQRDTTENVIWGISGPDSEVTLSITGDGYSESGMTVCDLYGFFQVQLPAIPAGGPYCIKVSSGGEEKVINNVLFGDVFVLSGQSNMELMIDRVYDEYKDYLDTLDDDNIRAFQIDRNPVFKNPEEMLETGRWMSLNRENLMLFSAVGLFAAIKIRKEIGVPIGMYQTAVGGSPICSWLSEESVRRLSLDTEDLDKAQQDGYVKKVEEADLKRDTAWLDEAKASFKKFDEDGISEKSFTGVEFPGYYGKYIGHDFCGSVVLTKKFVVGDDVDVSQPARLTLGVFRDADEAYINGKFVGETLYRYPPRKYELPAGTLKKGENVLKVNLYINRGEGWAMPGKDYMIKMADGTVIDLKGNDLDIHVVKTMEELPYATFFIYYPTANYHGIIYPIQRQRVKGVFWYQGESNVMRYETYRSEFAAMTADWRRIFREPELPFISVQIASYSEGDIKPEKYDWADFREAQLQCESIDNSCMVQAYDLGEYNDLHPVKKKPVGERVAEAALKTIYEKKPYFKGPSMKDIKTVNDGIKITFKTKTSLVAKGSEDGVIKGFSFVKENENGKTFIPAEGKLEADGSVFVKLPVDQSFDVISYAWNNSPDDANLYDKEDKPTVPFYTLLSQ